MRHRAPKTQAEVQSLIDLIEFGAVRVARNRETQKGGNHREGTPISAYKLSSTTWLKCEL